MPPNKKKSRIAKFNSDVLKRHVEFHPQYYKSKRNFVACTRCRESKTKCDENTPCAACRRRAQPCVRSNTSIANMDAESMDLEPTPDLLSSPSRSTHAPEESNLGLKPIVTDITGNGFNLKLVVEFELAFAMLRLDAYLSALIDFPPLIRYQELSMPLSQSTCWVNVASEDERRKLLNSEPAMRKKTSFSFRVHDLFGVSRQNALASSWTKMDYHFILCAIQSGAWEACHQALRTVPDDIQSRTHCHDLRNMWRELRREYFTKPRGDDMTPQTLLLWHITSLKLQAPPDLWALQERYYKLRPAGTSPDQKSHPHPSIRPWQVSKVARVAVWHSAQIARIVSTELGLENSTTRLRLNPLLIPALLMASLVTLGYTYYARVCPRCTGGGIIDLVNIFEAPKDCERLVPWLEEGVGLTNWGITVFTGLPVCQCSVIRMSKWFRELLSRDKQADAALVLFLNELKAGLW
ncbi:hypothetical protein FHL15_006413 [Xylaria flabelliformis]|uniref:Zn(2)-C6 fungal-type domain-containing protein n=1 Tax=Xylaria flabelliformis TaxID=2512241 RepID=A0A553HXR8_9PEZI|nr:hypothetical protein FHL15_006413 [Xylaria flabelliformis]